MAGTYALDRLDGLTLDIIAVTNGYARLRFLAISGRTYRLTSTANLTQAFANQAFALTPGAPPALNYLAPASQYLDVFVDVRGAPTSFFKLYVQ